MQYILLMALACLMAITGPVAAKNYPDKQVRIVVGYPPGGASDIVARLLAQELTAANNQPFIVENKPGLGGMLGLSDVAKSAADGHILGLGVSGTLVIGPHLEKNRLYDPKNDFAPISMIAKGPMVLLAGPGLKHDSVAGLVAEARAKPGDMMFASGAQAFEMALQLFNSMENLKMSSVPYKGGAAASIDVIAGRVPIMVDSIGGQLANIRSGKLRALAVLDSSRFPALPEVPTMQEAGVKGYEAVGWISLMAPKGTPPDVIAKLNTQINRIVKKPEMKERLISLGFEPATGTPEALQKVIDAEYKKWGEVVQKSTLAAN